MKKRKEKREEEKGRKYYLTFGSRIGCDIYKMRNVRYLTRVAILANKPDERLQIRKRLRLLLDERKEVVPEWLYKRYDKAAPEHRHPDEISQLTEIRNAAWYKLKKQPNKKNLESFMATAPIPPKEQLTPEYK